MGNLVVGQSGGPTAVINSSLAGVYQSARDSGIEKVYGMHYGVEGLIRDDLILLNECFPHKSDLSLLKRTPAMFLGTCRYKLPKAEEDPEVYETIFQRLEQYNISVFLYIGGNDSMDTIQQLSDYAAAHKKPQKFIGIPKTIDNDLPATDHTPGYGSAAKFIGTSIKEIVRDTESFYGKDPKISIVEIMGRNAGWLTAASALSRDIDCIGPDLILLPERVFQPEAFIDQIRGLAEKKKSIVIAASEGIKTADGKLVCELSGSYAFTDPFGHRQLSGSGKVLGDLISEHLGYKNRVIEFSILQRCATHLASQTDIDEAFNCGYIGVEKALAGETGKMVTIQVRKRSPYLVAYETKDIHGIANEEKRVPDEMISKDGTDVTEEFIRYARPLISGIQLPYDSAGVPRHTTLN